MKLVFETCTFVTSSDGRHFPKGRWPHLALVGRSNVGKSSLINHLLGNKALARVSSVPGKTRLIHFFLLDELLYLVDLPGFGYAKVSYQEQGKWEEMIETYFDAFADKLHFIHLIDARQGITPFDASFIDWARLYGKKVLFVFTKMDKINKSERKNREMKLQEELNANNLGTKESVLFYSIKEKESRPRFLREAQQFMGV